MSYESLADTALPAGASLELARESGHSLQEREQIRGVVVAHHRAIWRFLRRLGLDAEDAQDAVQDVMMVFSEKFREVIPGKEGAYLYATAYRVAMRVRRAKATRREQPDDAIDQTFSGGLDPAELTDKSRARELLDMILEQLPIETRAVFVLTEIEGMAAPEIAEVLEIPVGTVASRLRRAREDFRQQVTRLQARSRFEEGS